MLAAVAVVAAVMLAVLRTFDTSDALPTSAASLPPRLDEAASTPAPAARGANVDIVLSADGVGDLAFGTPMDDAVEQLTEWLGPPSRGPAEYSCEMGGPQVGDVYDWDGFSVSSRDGALEAWVLGNGFGEPLHAPAPSQPPAEAGPRGQPGRRTETPQRTDQPAAARNGQRPTEPAQAAPVPTVDDAEDEGAGSEWWWVLGGTGILAAGVAATLARLRSVWLRRRSAGDERTPPLPEAAAQAAALAIEATPRARDRAVGAVRAYAAGVADLDQPPPVIAGVTVDPAGTIALLLLDAAPDRLPDGWTRDPSDPRQVQLPASAELPADASGTGFPVGAGLVTVGIGVRSRRRLLLNLDTTGSLTLDGRDDLTTATMLAWAVELATSEHADALDVWLVGFDLDTPADRWERLHPVDTVTDAIDGLRTVALGDTAPTGLPARHTPDWIPQIVLCAPTVHDEDLETLARFARPYHHAGVTIVTADSAVAAAWRIEIAAEQLTITSLRDPVALRPTRRITRDEFHAITGLVATAAGDATATFTTPTRAAATSNGERPSAAGLLDRIALPATPPDVRRAIDEHRDDLVVVHLLGPVRIATPGGDLLPGGRVGEAVAYLACHRRGTSIDQLVDVLWHGGTATPQRLAEVLSRARAALGGTHRLPRMDVAGGYQLAPTVVTDLDLMAAHVRHARHHPNTLATELSAAVELIAGRPFADVDWPWATVEGLATDAAALACDVAAVLGDWHVDHDDPAGALRAARYGMRAAPESEQLARLRMRAYHQRGEPDQLRAVMDDLRAAADHPDPTATTNSTPTPCGCTARLPTPDHRGSRTRGALMGTVRRTVTMPAQLAVAIDAAVADGAADSVSALLATAVGRYLEQLTDDRLITHAARLDPDTELTLIRRVRAGAAPAGWERLT